MHAESVSKPRSTYQFNSAHFPSIVRHVSIISNSGLIQNPTPAVTKVRRYQNSTADRLLQNPQKSGLTDREQEVLTFKVSPRPDWLIGNSQIDGAVYYRVEEGRSLIQLAGVSALPAEVIFQSNSCLSVENNSSQSTNDRLLVRLVPATL
jgi:hypothetical protein